MKKSWQIFVTLILVTCLTVIIQPRGHLQVLIRETSLTPFEQVMAQELSDNDKRDLQKKSITPDSSQSGAPVIFEGETLFYIKTERFGISPQNRARRTTKRIEEIAKDYSQSVDEITADKAGDIIIISTSKRDIATLIPADAEAANQSLDDLGQESLQTIKAAITKYRQQRSAIHLLVSTIYTILSIAAFIVVMKTTSWLHKRNVRWLRIWLKKRQRAPGREGSAVWQWSEAIELDLYRFVYAIHQIIYWIISLIIIYLFAPLMLGFLPWTKRLSNEIFSHLSKVINNGWNGFLNYLPNLLVIGFTVISTYYIVQLCKRFFDAVENGTISISGFYPDWSGPTYRLVSFLIYALSLAIIYPYLPGADSASFQGISIFIGAIVTIGGASTLANIVGGFIVIYTRAYRIGDRIQIDDLKGDVVEKSILSTRICTPNNEVVTIPNSTINGSNIINYTVSKRDFDKPLLLHTKVSFCYDVPWRKVQQTLLSAAEATSHILKEPAPFVIQASLDDTEVIYQLKAYTAQPSRMLKTYSELHANILDKCDEMDITISDRHVVAIRNES